MGGTPVAVAVLVVDPRSTSAWVSVYVAVNVVESPGARVATEAGVIAPSSPVPSNSPSLTVTSVIVTLPELVTKNE